MPDLFGLASSRPLPLADRLGQMLACSSADPLSPAFGWVGDIPFSGTCEELLIPQKNATHGALLVGGEPPGQNALVDPFSFRTEVLQESGEYLKSAPGRVAPFPPLFGACLMRRGRRLVAGRDRLGTRPLFVAGGDPVAFSSLRHALHDFQGEPKPLPPSRYLVSGEDNAIDVPRMFRVKHPSSGCPAETALEALRSALQPVPSPRALFFSGGIDSVVLAHLLESMPPTTLICAGVKGCRDWESARAAADSLADPLELVEIPVQRIGDDVLEIRRLCGNQSPVNIAVALPVLHAAKRARELGIRVGLAGFGADELFGGYNRYLNDQDAENSMMMDLLALHQRGMNACDLVCRAQGIRLYLPYLEEEIIHLAMSLPIQAKVDGGRRKVFLRELGTQLGIRDRVALAEKRAIQYGSGVNKYVMKALRKDG